METNKRSLFKTVTWYTCHLTLATTVAYIITGSLKIAATLASLELVWEAALFYSHERAWAKWGKRVK
jgi:uncharacterized membrane protein